MKKGNLKRVLPYETDYNLLFLTELIHHINFIIKLEQLFDRFKEKFSKKADETQTLQDAVLLFLDYETTLAYNKAPLSDTSIRAT